MTAQNTAKPVGFCGLGAAARGSRAVVTNHRPQRFQRKLIAGGQSELGCQAIYPLLGPKAGRTTER